MSSINPGFSPRQGGELSLAAARSRDPGRTGRGTSAIISWYLNELRGKARQDSRLARLGHVGIEGGSVPPETDIEEPPTAD